MEWLIAILSFLATPVPKSNTCTASVFGYRGDKMAGGDAVCVHRRLNSSDIGVAHRTLPCGSKVVVQNVRTGQMALATVVDHGPYGAVDENGEWVLKRNKSEPGRWRGCLDMTRKLQELIGHNGFEKVIYSPVAQR